MSMRALWLGVALAACSEDLPNKGELLGGSLAKDLQADMSAAEALAAPHRCARQWSDAPVPPKLGDWQFAAESSGVLQGSHSGEDGQLSVLVVADMRSFGSAGLEKVDALMVDAAKTPIDLVISLGGHDTADLSAKALFASLSVPGALTWALAGDREDVGAHRRLVAELRDEGLPIVDATRHPVLDIEGWRLLALPGVENALNLVAGSEGCVHTLADVQDLATSLEGRADRSSLVLSYAPIRQAGEGGSDVGPNGVHLGERDPQILSNSKAVLGVLHGMVSPPTGGPSAGRVSAKKGAPHHFAAGSLDPLEPPTGALLVQVKGERLTWKRLSVSPN